MSVVGDRKPSTSNGLLNPLSRPVLLGTFIGVTEHLISVAPRNFIDYKQYFHSSKEATKQYQKNIQQSKFNAFKGTIPYLSGAALGHIGLFSCLEQSKKDNYREKWLTDAGWGVAGKLCHDTCITPFDTLRMRANIGNVSVVEAYKQLEKVGGMKGFFRGLPAAIAMNAPAGAAEFVVLNASERLIGSDGAKPFVSAFLAGIVSSVIVSPIDTIKTCLQCTGLKTPSTSTLTEASSLIATNKTSWFQVSKHIYQHRGILGFFRGVGLRCISTTVTFGLYEFVRHYFNLDFKE